MSVERDVFRRHPLTELYIRYSRLENHVSLAYIKHTPVVLNLYHGNISYIPKDYFCGCRVLRKVVLTHNRIASLPDLGYISNTLYDLGFLGNILSSLDVLDNVIFPVLYALILQGNNISSFDVTSLLRMPCLSTLYISHNRLTHFQNPEAFIISKIMHFKLGKNPWDCGSDLSWMLQWGRIKTMYVPDITVRAIFKNFDIRDMVDVECYTPRNLQGIKLWNMSKLTSYYWWSSNWLDSIRYFKLLIRASDEINRRSDTSTSGTFPTKTSPTLPPRFLPPG